MIAFITIKSSLVPLVEGLCTGVKLQRAVQVILMEVCDLSAGEAARFTVHSCRHCLPHCCAASHEPPEGSVECGRWATSTAQMHDLIPSELRQATEAKRAGNMPGSFIFSSYEGGTCWRNLTNQLHRVRNVTENTDWKKPPRLERGFDLLAPYVASRPTMVSKPFVF